MSADPGSGHYEKPTAPPLSGGWDDPSSGGPHDGFPPPDRYSTTELPVAGEGQPRSAIPLGVSHPLATQLPGSEQPPVSPPVTGYDAVPGSVPSASAPLSGHYHTAQHHSSQFAPPSSPPTRYRPESATSQFGGSSPFLSEAARTSNLPAGGRPTPEPAGPIVRPPEGWGWRTLVAFVAGGLLTASGFAVAQLSDGGTSLETSQAGADSTTTSEPEPETTETTDSPVMEATTTEPPLVSDSVQPAVSVAEVLGPSVVQIETDIGIGSGVLYDDGLVMTNAHVVEGAETLTVQLSDGERLTAQIVGVEPRVDIAVVSVGEGRDLPVATLATGGEVQVGQTAIAIGSPFSLQQSVTEGIVSAVGRPVPSRGGSFVAMIQTDAPINPGNSGGALADVNGRVIGINTAIQTDGSSGNNAGVGFAIPIDTALSVADRLVAGVPIEEGFLGIGGDVAPDGAAGVQVQEITEGSAAEAAGLEVGDRITAVDGAPVTQFPELAGLIMAHIPGDVIELEVVRNGETIVLEVTLVSRADFQDE